MEKIKNIIITLLSSWSLSIILLYTIGIVPNVLLILIIAFICLILFYNIYTTTFTLFMAVCVVLQIINDMQVNPDYILYKYVNNIINNVIQYFSGNIPINQIITITISSIVTAFIVMIASLMLRKTKVSIIFILISFCTILITIIFGNNIPVIYYIVWLISELILVWRYFSSDEFYAWKMIPVCASCILIALVIPNVNFHTISSHISTVLDVPMKWIDDKVYGITGARYFAISHYGYNSTLGGNIELTDNPVMTVKTLIPIYLAGAKYDVYTGSSWESSVDDTWLPDGYEAESIEFLERIASNILMSYATGEFDSFAELLSNNTDGYKTALLMPMQAYNKINTEVTILDRTFVLYTMPLTTDISNDKYKLNDDGHIVSDKLLTDNTTYTITYRSNGTVSYWQSIMDSSYRGVLNDINNKLKELHKVYDFSPEQEAIMLVDGPKPNLNLHHLFTYAEDEIPYTEGEAIPYETLLEEVLIPYTESIYERYTQLPEVYPERIKVLTQDIIANAMNDYEKASLIMRYLKQFPYTLSPGDPDVDMDFVDQFLFDGQQGYCQYFATAFVIMCRTIDLPARYVEGFHTKGKRTDGIYTVTKDQAHAWAEVYLEGYGWVTFDPTSSSEVLSPSRGYLGEVLESHLAGAYDDLGNEYEPVEIITDMIYDTESTTAYVPKQFGLYIILPFIVLIIISLSSRHLHKIKYIIMSPERAVVWSVKYLRSILRKDINKSSYKTVRQEFTSSTLSEIYPIINEIVLLYEKSIYGTYQPNAEDKKRIWDNLYLIKAYRKGM